MIYYTCTMSCADSLKSGRDRVEGAGGGTQWRMGERSIALNALFSPDALAALLTTVVAMDAWWSGSGEGPLF